MLTIFTDTDTDITLKDANEFGIKLIPMPYIMDEKVIYTYRDFEEFDYKPYYDRLRGGYVPKTAALNMAEYIEIFEEEYKKGNDILYIHFSNKLSGTFNAMNMAVDELKEKYPERKFTAIDTLTISCGSYSMIVDFLKEVKKGKSVEELVKWAEEERQHYNLLIMADDLQFFKASGRVSGVAAFAGTLLNLKPLIKIFDDGTMGNYAKVRGSKAGIDAFIKEVEQNQIDIKKHGIVVGHADAKDNCDKLINGLKAKFGDDLPIRIVLVNPTIGAHCGPGAIGIGYYGKKR